MNKNLTLTLICLCSIFAAACGPSTPSTSSIETAVAQTQAVMPPPIFTPLSEIDLESILLLSGDLPTTFVEGQAKNIPPKRFEGLPTADQVIQQGFRTGSFASDGILIILYKSLSDLDTAYSTVKKVLDRATTFQPLSDVGEKATIAEEIAKGVEFTQITFVRCHALVYIDLSATSAEEATTYARRLDKRLAPLVCP